MDGPRSSDESEYHNQTDKPTKPNSSEMEEPQTFDYVATAPKRQKKNVADWVISFEDVQPLRLTVEAVYAVMSRVMFNVKKRADTGTFFLCVDGADVGYTCCVSARLQLDDIQVKDKDCGQFKFCVECKHLLIALGSSASSIGSVSLEGHNNEACIMVRVHDSDAPSYQDTSKISTYVEGDPDVKLSDMNFKLTIEIDVVKLRENFKKAKSARAEKMRIRVYISEVNGGPKSMTIFSVKGDNQEHSQTFCSELGHDEDGSVIVRAAADGSTAIFDVDDKEPRFDHLFPIDKIESFVKHLPTRMLVAKVDTNLPMLLAHNLRGSTDGSSHIRFLVASVTNDDEC